MKRPDKTTGARLRAVANAIASAPCLGAFACAVAQLGLDGAVALCTTRDPSPRLQGIWSILGHTLEQLPSGEEIRLFLIGCEIQRRLVNKRGQGKVLSLQALTHSLCTLEEVSEAVELMDNYGAKVEPLVSALGVL